MQTRILPLACDSAQGEALDLLEKGAVIAAPTDTVYGVMCRYDRPAAIESLFAIKKRSPDKAIPILIGDRAQLGLVVQEPVTRAAEMLIERFWPGPLTLVLPARPELPFALTAGATTVGVRMPAHAGLCALMRRSGPLAATSANLSGAAETHTAAEVARQLATSGGAGLSLILYDETSHDASHDASCEDAPCEAGLAAGLAHRAEGRLSPASTVADLSGPAPRILRSGPIATEVAAALAEMGLAIC